MKNVFTAFFLLLGIAGCKHDPQPLPSGSSSVGGQPGPGPGPGPVTYDSVSFQTEVLPILLSNCAMSGCHAQNNPQKGIRLNSYDNVMNSGEINPGNPDKSELVEMIEEPKDKDRMPPLPASRLPQSQIDLIRKWITEGARNTNIAKCDTNVFTFTAVNNIVGASCRGCHGTLNPGAGINLTEYSGIKNAVQSGKLLCAINHEPGCSPMPQGGARLEACKITIIRKWADDGCPQN